MTHRHELPYLMCVVEGSRIDAEIEGMGHVEIPVQSGSVLFVPPGSTEMAINGGDRVFREILIELKAAGGSDAKLAVANMPTEE